MASTAPRERIVVGLSGGVDSAVAAWLLKREGHEVVAIFMKNWEGDDDDEYCSSRQDFLDAASVADVVGIELEHVNFAAEYRERVFAEFLREYGAGRTPNPDVLCNAEIKFRSFLDHAVAVGADRIATGHYARVEDGALKKGVDASKDQSYFLHRLTRAQLDRSLFPLGGRKKTDVRRLAEEIGLPNAAKRDSTGICFIGERPFRAFLSQWIEGEPGPIEDARGRVVGEHVGLSHYTIGQRKGIGVGGLRPPGGIGEPKPRRGADGSGDHAPWFVAGKDLARNVLVVVQGHDHPRLLSRTLSASDASWTSGTPPRAGARLAAKTRYRQADAPCRVEAAGDDGSLRLAFDEPQWAIAPGQSAVLYDGDVCLGGAFIGAPSHDRAARGRASQPAAL